MNLKLQLISLKDYVYGKNNKQQLKERTASTEVMCCSLVTRWNASVHDLPRMPCAAAIMLPAAIIDAGYATNEKSTYNRYHSIDQSMI